MCSKQPGLGLHQPQEQQESNLHHPPHIWGDSHHLLLPAAKAFKASWRKQQVDLLQKPSRCTRDGDCSHPNVERKGVNYSPGVNTDLTSLNISSKTPFPLLPTPFSHTSFLLHLVLYFSLHQARAGGPWASCTTEHGGRTWDCTFPHASPAFQLRVANSSNKQSKY